VIESSGGWESTLFSRRPWKHRNRLEIRFSRLYCQQIQVNAGTTTLIELCMRDDVLEDLLKLCEASLMFYCFSRSRLPHEPLLYLIASETETRLRNGVASVSLTTYISERLISGVPSLYAVYLLFVALLPKIFSSRVRSMSSTRQSGIVCICKV
jgi:hypothetical protein